MLVLCTFSSEPCKAQTFLNNDQPLVAGAWRGNDAFFQSLTLSNIIVEGERNGFGHPQHRFVAELSEQFCKKTNIKCPENRKLEGTYFVTGHLGSVTDPLRIWFRVSGSLVFDIPRGVGSVFHATIADRDGRTLVLVPRYDFHNRIRPRQISLIREGV
jgi:hypothetical protein